MNDDDFFKRFRKAPPAQFEQALSRRLQQIDEEQPVVTAITPPRYPYLIRLAAGLALVLALGLLLWGLRPMPDQSIHVQVQVATETPTPTPLPTEPVPVAGIPCPENFRTVVIARRNIRAGELLTEDMVQLTCWSETDNEDRQSDNPSVRFVGFGQYKYLFDSIESVVGLHMMTDVRQWSPINKQHAFRIISETETDDGFIVETEHVMSYSSNSERGQQIVPSYLLSEAAFYGLHLGDQISIAFNYLDLDAIEGDCRERYLAEECGQLLAQAITQETMTGEVIHIGQISMASQYISIVTTEAEAERLELAFTARLPFTITVIQPRLFANNATQINAATPTPAPTVEVTPEVVKPACSEDFHPVVIAKKNIRAGATITEDMVQLTCWSKADNEGPENPGDAVTLIGFDQYAVLFTSIDEVLNARLITNTRQWSPLLKTHISQESFSFSVGTGREAVDVPLPFPAFHTLLKGDAVQVTLAYVVTSQIEAACMTLPLAEECAEQFESAIHEEVLVSSAQVAYVWGSSLTLSVLPDEVEHLEWAIESGLPLTVTLIEPASDFSR